MEQDNTSILVTGADGQLGRELRRTAEGSPLRWVFTDVAQLDITDPGAVRKAVAETRAGVIVNCAAYTHVERAEDDAQAADRINHLAPGILAGAAREAGATLIHISTDYVFGGAGNVPRREDDPVCPLGVYGRTKLAGERAIGASGCSYLIFRTAWLYSEYGNNFVKTMLRLTAERERVRVVFDQVGSPTYAADLAALIARVVGQGSYRGREGIYHFSNEGVCSWYDLAYEVARMAGGVRGAVEPCHSDEFPAGVKRPAYSVLDKTRVRETFGIDIPHWREALGRCLQRIQANENI